MRLSLAAVALIAAVAAGAAPAEAAGLSGMGKNIFGNYFKFPKANLPSVPVDAITVGKLKIDLQHTRLAEVKKAFGGTIQAEGDGDSEAHWLCYATDGSNGPAANVWFISNGQGGHEFIMMVAAQLASKPDAGCDPAPAGFAVPEFGIPGLGAPVADLKARFGAARASGGAISYRADEPAADALGTALNVQYIGYMVSKNVVSGIGVGEGPAQISQ